MQINVLLLPFYLNCIKDNSSFIFLHFKLKVKIFFWEVSKFTRIYIELFKCNFRKIKSFNLVFVLFLEWDLEHFFIVRENFAI